MFRRQLIYKIVLFLTNRLSRRKFILVGKMISLIYYAFGIKSKSIVKENLKHNHIKFSIKLYLNFAHFLCENIYLLSNELDENIFELHNIELFNRAVKSDKGVMLLSFHYGGWDISGQLLSKYGYPINVIYENKKEWIYEYLDKLRKKYNTTLINRDSPVNIFLEILNKGEVLTVFIDQQSDNLALKTVKFLNISKAVPSGWYKLLRISKAIPIFCYSVYKKSKHHLYFIDSSKYRFEDYYNNIDKIIRKDIYQYDFYNKIWEDISI